MKASDYRDIGQYLRDSRESLKISIGQAAHALHIRARYLEALESGRVESLPGKTYVRGYIRNYAGYLHLDPDEVLAAYESLIGDQGRDFFVPEPTLKQNMPSRRLLWLTLAGFALVYGYWYFGVHDRTKLPETVTEMPETLLGELDKRPLATMDKALESCLGDSGCFDALHTLAVYRPAREFYDLPPDLPTQQP